MFNFLYFAGQAKIIPEKVDSVLLHWEFEQQWTFLLLHTSHLLKVLPKDAKGSTLNRVRQ